MRTFKPRQCATCTQVFMPTGPKNRWCSTPCRLLDCCDSSGGENACWVWKSAKDKNGYGIMKMPEGCEFSHRIMYETTHSCILSPKEVVRHSCDTPLCINPRHLLLGTQADNVKDMWDRDRQQTYGNKGSKNPNATIDEAIAIAVYQTVGSYKELSDQFGLPSRHIEQIKRGESWTHATGAVYVPTGQLKGEQNGTSKLTEDNVREILQHPEVSLTRFSRKFSVSKTTISLVRKRTHWKHVTI